MTAAVKGKTRAEAEELFDGSTTRHGELPEASSAPLGSLRAFGGVSKFPHAREVREPGVARAAFGARRRRRRGDDDDRANGPPDEGA